MVGASAVRTIECGDTDTGRMPIIVQETLLRRARRYRSNKSFLRSVSSLICQLNWQHIASLSIQSRPNWRTDFRVSNLNAAIRYYVADGSFFAFSVSPKFGVFPDPDGDGPPAGGAALVIPFASLWRVQQSLRLIDGCSDGAQSDCDVGTQIDHVERPTLIGMNFGMLFTNTGVGKSSKFIDVVLSSCKSAISSGGAIVARLPPSSLNLAISVLPALDRNQAFEALVLDNKASGSGTLVEDEPIGLGTFSTPADVPAVAHCGAGTSIDAAYLGDGTQFVTRGSVIGDQLTTTQLGNVKLTFGGTNDLTMLIDTGSLVTAIGTSLPGLKSEVGAAIEPSEAGPDVTQDDACLGVYYGVRVIDGTLGARSIVIDGLTAVGLAGTALPNPALAGEICSSVQLAGPVPADWRATGTGTGDVTSLITAGGPPLMWGRNSGIDVHCAVTGSLQQQAFVQSFCSSSVEDCLTEVALGSTRLADSLLAAWGMSASIIMQPDTFTSPQMAAADDLRSAMPCMALDDSRCRPGREW